MALVQERALAHACPVVTAVGARQIIIGFAPSDNLACSQWSVLDILVLVRITAMLAPSAFAFALLAVVMCVSKALIVHFENLVVRECLLRLLFGVLFKLVNVRVFHGHLAFKSFNFLLGYSLLVAFLMLRMFRDRCTYNETLFPGICLQLVVEVDSFGVSFPRHDPLLKLLINLIL